MINLIILFFECFLLSFNYNRLHQEQINAGLLALRHTDADLIRQKEEHMDRSGDVQV